MELKQDYLSVCKLMVKSYNELVDKLTSPDVIALINKETWLLFGTSKFGKSTLLLRLKSVMDKFEFMDVITESNKRTNEIIDIEGIKIRSGALSTTIVPNFLIQEDQLLLDLAGFCETDEDRVPVISLLNNNLLSHLKKCKIMIILDISNITNLNMPLFKYMSEFKELMSEKYLQSGLRSCCFVLTKADIYSDNIIKISGINPDEFKDPITEAVNKILSEFISQIVIDNPEMARFAGFIKNNFYVVDYRSHSSDDIKKNIKNMMDKIQVIDSSEINFNMSSTNIALNAQGCELSNYYVGRYKSCVESLIDVESNLNSNLIANVKTLMDNDNSILNLESKIDNGVKANLMLKLKMKENEDDVDKFKKRIDVLIPEEESLNQQLLSFTNKVSKLTTLHITTLESYHWKRTFKNIHRVTSKIRRPIGSISNLHVFVMTLKNFLIYENEIFNCTDMKTFEDRKLPYVFFDGQFTNNLMLIRIDGESDKIYSIHTESNFPHVILFMADVRIMDTIQIELMTDFFKDHHSIIQLEILSSNKSIQKLLAENKDSRNEVESILIGIAKSKDECEKLRVSTQITKSQFENFIDNSISKIDFIMSEVNKVIGEEKFLFTEELIKILTTSRIEINSFKPMINLRTKFLDILNDKIRLKNIAMEILGKIISHNM